MLWFGPNRPAETSETFLTVEVPNGSMTAKAGAAEPQATAVPIATPSIFVRKRMGRTLLTQTPCPAPRVTLQPRAPFVHGMGFCWRLSDKTFARQPGGASRPC